MKIATYNILKGGSRRVHWVKMIEDQWVDLFLAQESYTHDEHLQPDGEGVAWGEVSPMPSPPPIGFTPEFAASPIPLLLVGFRSSADRKQ